MTVTNNFTNYFLQNTSSTNGQYIIPPLNISSMANTNIQNPLFNYQNTNLSSFPTVNFGQNLTFNSFGNYNTFTTQFPDYSEMFGQLITMYNNTIANIQKMDASKMFSPIQSDYSDADTTNFSYDAGELKERWAKKKPNLSDEFYNKVVQVAKRLNCSPDDLMAVMNAESGINPTAKNPNSSATGLIQFTEATAKGLGTTTSALKKMSAEEQLVYVEKYLANTKRNANLKDNDKITASTLYTMVFLPSKVNKNVITNAGEAYYEHNKGLDINKDGVITKDELGQRVKNFMA